MSVYRELLHEIGIEVPPDFEECLCAEKEKEEEKEKKDEYALTLFIEIHAHIGLDINGYAVPREWRAPKIHRYDRRLRFLNVLLTFLNGDDERSVVDNRYVYRERCNAYMHLFTSTINSDSPSVYSDVRRVLKQYRLVKLYLQIPRIIYLCGGPKIRANDQHIHKILGDYCVMSIKHENRKRREHKTYFPNLRAVVITLMKRNGVIFPYFIPTTQSLAKTFEIERGISMLLQV